MELDTEKLKENQGTLFIATLLIETDFFIILKRYDI